MNDTIEINSTELKKQLAYLNVDDLLYTLREYADYLMWHSKNLTKEQYYRADALRHFVNNLKGVTP